MTLTLAATGLLPLLAVASYPFHARRALARSRAAVGHVVPKFLSVIVPSRGSDGSAEVALSSWTSQEWPGEAELLICVESVDEPIVGLVAEALAAGCRITPRVVVSGDAGPNLGKTHNLEAGLLEASGDMVVLIDSDTILPDTSFLWRLAGMLGTESAGMVTCFPVYRRARSLGAALLSLTVNQDLLGLFSLQATWGGLKSANGSCMAFRRHALEAIGGLQGVRNRLLMDTQLALQVRQAGMDVLLSPWPVEVRCERASVTAWLSLMHRWHVAMRRVLPGLSYVSFCWLKSWWMAGVLLLALGSEALTGVLLVGGLGVRIGSYLTLRRRYLSDSVPGGYLWLSPVVEISAAVSALYALVNSRVRWRGRILQVGRGGIVTVQAD